MHFIYKVILPCKSSITKEQERELESQFVKAIFLVPGKSEEYGRKITSFKMSPTSLGGGKQTTTAGEHISQCGRIKAATLLC